MSESSLESLRERLAAGVDPAALHDPIRRVVTARRGVAGEHVLWGLLCEEVGLFSLAFSEFQLALRDDPNDPVAAFHLAQHYRERGDTGRAVGLLERLLAQEPAHEAWLTALVEILQEEGAEPRARKAIERALQAGLPEAVARRLERGAARRTRETPDPDTTAERSDWTPNDADCIRFHTLFDAREGVYARQWVRPSGESGYSPIHEPLTPAVIRNHLLGVYTVGVYPIRLDGTATFFAVDLDINKTALQRAHGDPPYAQQLRDTLRCEAARLLQTLRDLGFSPLFENSGYKGRHFWVFLEEPETAETLHLLGRLFLGQQTRQIPDGLHLEFFPKQAGVKQQGLGNLIKLPLGIHRRTGRRSQLLDDQGRPIDRPLEALRRVVRTPRSVLYAALERLKAALPQGAADAPTPLKRGGVAQTLPSSERPPAGPAPPPPAPVWTEADFETDPRVRHLLAHCPVLAELKRTADEHRRLSHEEQLVLIHSLGYVDGGPQAVNYLFAKCVDVGPEKLMKDRLKGNPVSCGSIRKKIPHITRRVSCHCPFEFAKDRYPTPVLHLLTLPQDQRQPPPASYSSERLHDLALRLGVLERQRSDLERQWKELRQALTDALRTLPERTVNCPGGRYRLLERDGVEELVWEAEPQPGA